MSLKIIHIAIMVMSVILTLSFAAWGYQDFLHGSGSRINLGLACASLAASAGLIYYLFWFVHKLRKAGL
ncbi:MAG TPA: hypothetical protein VL688_05125 [Verrucomicrobiae bacterium]|jgi:hypothetical protein|nr:hypothetical protein [Verrucomicrobiae bacterium]